LKLQPVFFTKKRLKAADSPSAEAEASAKREDNKNTGRLGEASASSSKREDNNKDLNCLGEGSASPHRTSFTKNV